VSDIVKITPESLEVANTYLATGSVEKTAKLLGVTEFEVSSFLNRREVKKYVDQVFLDQGYRNRHKLFDLLDTIIDSKITEAEESEIYTTKDILDVLTLMHKMRVDEIKLMKDDEAKNQPKAIPKGGLEETDPDNPDQFGGGNYGKLMRSLFK